MTASEPEEEGNATLFKKARSWLASALDTVTQAKKRYFSKQFAIFLHWLFKRIVRSLARGGSRSFIANIAGAVAETIQEKASKEIRGTDKEKEMLLPKARRTALKDVIKACRATDYYNAKLNYQGTEAYLCIFYNESERRKKHKQPEKWEELGRLIDVHNLALHHSTTMQGGDLWSMYEISFTDKGKEAEGRAIFETSGPERWRDAKYFIKRAAFLVLLISLLGYQFLLVVLIALISLAFLFEKENKK